VTIPVQEACPYRKFNGATQICAGDTNPSDPKSSCFGDSGGPFMQQNATTGQWHVAGIVSYGTSGCSGNGGFTRVAAFEKWITDTMRAN
jgi:secreted trypsin-like serine protease